MYSFIINLQDESVDQLEQYINFAKIVSYKPFVLEIQSNIHIENKFLYLYNKLKKKFCVKLIKLPITNLPYTNNTESEWFTIKDLKNNKITKLLKLIYKNKIQGKKEKSELIENIEAKIYNFESADILLRKTNQIVNTNLRGQVIIGPGLTKLIKLLESLFIEICIFDFQEIFLPKLIALDTWYKTGHIQKTLNEAYYVSRFITRTPEYSENLKNKYLIDGTIDAQIFKENTTNIIGGMTYAQCEPIWQYFENKIISKSKLPICIYDRSGPSYRYEGKAIHSITRLDEFHRLESIFIVEQEQMNTFIENLKNRFKNFLNILELKYRILNVDSWMTTDNSFVKTIDFELFLPFENRFLETLNLSNNCDEYVTKFKIKTQNYAIYTGCSGLGLERIAYSFIAQKGLNSENWPKCIKTNIQFNSFIL